MPLDVAAWPLPAVEVTRDGALERANGAALAMLGDAARPSRVLGAFGLTKGDLMNARGRDALPGPALLRRQTPEGRPLCVLVTPNGAGGHVLLIQDDAARATADDEATRLRALVGALTDIGEASASFLMDARGVVTHWSRSAARLEGLGEAEAIGMPLSRVLRVGGLDLDGDAFLAKTRREGAHRHEGLRVSPARGLRWVVLTVTAAFDERGVHVGFAARIDEPTQDDAHATALRRLAETDPLTGALNHRAFEASATASCTMARARGRAFAVIALDVDGFKAVNDRHGHAAGDEALRAVVAAARAGTRTADLAGRLGGDEFAIALPGAGTELAGRIGQRLLRAIRGLAIGGGTGPRVTASLGVAASASPSESFGQTLARADEALYRAKAAGRDRLATA
jgi:diguanylate cyclase (GGDEF)-like protein/PAS domain S-box-containing protein